MYKFETAERVVKFVSSLYKAIGLTLPAYQKRFIEELYGNVKVNGLRQFRRCYFSVPRKNAKSTLSAALALYHLIADHEDNPRIFIAAPNLDTAGESFEIIARMVAAVPFLDKNCVVRDSRNAKEVTYYRDGKKIGYIKALTRGQKEGKNASVVIFDELCSFKEADRAVWNSMTKGSIARRQPLFIVTTTAAESNDGLAFEQYQHAKRVLEGHVLDPDLYPFIIEANPDKWDDPQEQIRCNPLVAEGFIPVENLEAEYQQAKVSDHALALFKRKTLNMWVGSSFAYLSGKVWLEQTEPIDDAYLIGKPCIAAFDLSKTRDFTALVLLFNEPLLDRQGYKYFVKPYFWLPSEGIEERQNQDGQYYDLWVEQGHLELSDGPTIDYHLLLDKLKELSAIYQITEVAYDPAFAEHLVQDITKAGLTSSPYPNKFFQMTAPLQTLQALVLNKQIVHGNNPILNWQVPQLEVKTNTGGGLMPSKKNRKAKIDGVVALLMGLGCTMRHQNAEEPSMQNTLAWFLS